MVAQLVVIVGWCAGWLLLWRPPQVVVGGQRTGRRADGRVSVVIPARNEADRLPDLLASLEGRPDLEVVVVDDDSLDATASVASRPGVEVVPAPPRPPGWTGKTWACHAGTQATTGAVVVFVDADVTFAEGALDAVVDLLDERGGLVSVQPHHHPRRLVERASLFFNIVAVMGLGIATPGHRRPGWGVAGPVLAATRADLVRIGGHESVRTEIAEDLALAARFRDAGARVTCVLGGAAVRFRMYRDLPSLVEGWTKNIATGARRTPHLLSLGVALWITALCSIALAVADEVLTGDLDGQGLLRALGLYLAVAVQVLWLGRRVGRFGGAAAVWPLPLAVFVGLVAVSFGSTVVAGRVRWSGRTIRVRRL